MLSDPSGSGRRRDVCGQECSAAAGRVWSANASKPWRLCSLPDGGERRRNLDFKLRCKSRGCRGASPPALRSGVRDRRPRNQISHVGSPGASHYLCGSRHFIEASCSGCRGLSARRGLPVSRVQRGQRPAGTIGTELAFRRAFGGPDTTKLAQCATSRQGSRSLYPEPIETSGY